jgi:hypothetical protein
MAGILKTIEPLMILVLNYFVIIVKIDEIFRWSPQVSSTLYTLQRDTL